MEASRKAMTHVIEREKYLFSCFLFRKEHILGNNLCFILHFYAMP